VVHLKLLLKDGIFLTIEQKKEKRNQKIGLKDLTLFAIKALRRIILIMIILIKKNV
jgi:hypothetical protein